MSVSIPNRLKEIIEDFAISEGAEKLELLLQYSQSLPPLPDRLQERSRMEFVPECMTPVYIQAETDGGLLTYYFDVPAESPTVRGFASIMAEGVNGAAPEQVLAIPEDFFIQMGLEKALTHQRLNGMAAILAHMKRLAIESTTGTVDG